jgi:hypothetical protein
MWTKFCAAMFRLSFLQFLPLVLACSGGAILAAGWTLLGYVFLTGAVMQQYRVLGVQR